MLLTTCTAGSSYGGLTAAMLQCDADAFRGLLLCAPALHLVEPPVDDKPFLFLNELKTIIIHGLEDDIVPLHAVLSMLRSSNEIADTSGRWSSPC